MYTVLPYNVFRIRYTLNACILGNRKAPPKGMLPLKHILYTVEWTTRGQKNEGNLNLPIGVHTKNYGKVGPMIITLSHDNFSQSCMGFVAAATPGASCITNTPALIGLRHEFLPK